MIVVALLARAKGGEGVKSGPIGLAVILVLCIAAYFLFKSMSKHLKKVRDGFPTDAPAQSATEPQPRDESPATPGDPVQSGDSPPRADPGP